MNSYFFPGLFWIILIYITRSHMNSYLFPCIVLDVCTRRQLVTRLYPIQSCGSAAPLGLYNKEPFE